MTTLDTDFRLCLAAALVNLLERSTTASPEDVAQAMTEAASTTHPPPAVRIRISWVRRELERLVRLGILRNTDDPAGYAYAKGQPPRYWK